MKQLFTLLCCFLAASQLLLAQAPNDNCADAIAIGSVTDLAFSTVDANTDKGHHDDPTGVRTREKIIRECQKRSLQVVRDEEWTPEELLEAINNTSVDGDSDAQMRIYEIKEIERVS